MCGGHGFRTTLVKRSAREFCRARLAKEWTYLYLIKNSQLVQRTSGLQCPEYYSIVYDLDDGVLDGSLHIIFVANVNLNSDGNLKADVNRFSNDNVWNAKNQHRIVVPKLTVSLPSSAEEFCFGGLFSSRPACGRFPLVDRLARCIYR